MVRRNAFFKSFRRDIATGGGRFMGMFAIVMLGVFVYAGLGFTGGMMKRIGNRYFSAQRLFDIQVVSTYGISERDLAAIREVPGVLEAVGAREIDALALTGADPLVIKVHSIPLDEAEATINRVTLLAGRYPQKPDEILVEPDLLNKAGLALGDNLTLDSGKEGDIRDSLKTNTFRIVGTVRSPLYFSTLRGGSSVGGGRTDCYLLIPGDCFRDGVYSAAYVALDGADGLYIYGDEYKELVDEAIERIEAVGDIRIPARKKEVTSAAWRRLREAENQLEQAEANAASGLAAARLHLEEGGFEAQKGRIEFALAQAELDDNARMLDAEELAAESGLAQLEAALSSVFDAERRLLDQKSELAGLQQQLDDAEAELIEGKTEAKTGQQRLDDGLLLLAEALAQLDGAIDQLGLSRDGLLDEKTQVESELVTESDPDEVDRLRTRLVEIGRELEDTNGQIDALKIQRVGLEAEVESVLAGKPALEAAFQHLRLGRLEMENSRQELEAGQLQLEQGIASVAALKDQLLLQAAEARDGLLQLRQARLELDTARTSLEQNRSRLLQSGAELRAGEAAFLHEEAETLRQLDAARQSVAESRKTLGDLSDPEWYVLDRESNLGYAGFSSDSDQIHTLGQVLPLMFFLVAALISLTTMSRLVEEQRTGMGTLKALGYGEGKILSKYIFYAFVPTFLGSLTGGYFGLLIFPRIILEGGFGGLYQLPPWEPEINLPYWLGGLAVAAGTTTLTTIYSCYHELQSVPAGLMRPRAPKTGKKTPMEYLTPLWRRLSFLYKVAFRNIFRYKKRLFMTLAGVGGCTALLLTGLGLNDSMAGLLQLQFSDLRRHDFVVTFSDDASEASVRSVEKGLMRDSRVAAAEVVMSEWIDAHAGDGLLKETNLFVPLGDNTSSILVFRERVGHAPLILGDHGVIVTEKLAYTCGLKAGDEIILRDSDDREYTARVSGVCEAYLMSYVYMTNSYYREVFGKDAEYNVIYTVSSPGASQSDTDNLMEGILDRPGVRSVSFKTTEMELFGGLLSGIGAVVWFVVLIAGMLAFVVLLNLTNINMAERIREIATIEVLGFRDREVSSYMYRENLIVSFAASLIGLYLGKQLHTYVCLTVEGDNFMLLRGIAPFSYAAAVAMTMLFSVSVALLTNGRLKKINMIEALKSIE